MSRSVSKSNVEMVQHDKPPRTLTDVVKLCENELGWSWSWDDPRPSWKIRSAEVSKMKSVIKKLERENRHLKGKFTVENLLLAIEHMKQEREYIKSPVYVLYHVERALERAAESDDLGDLDTAVQEALSEVAASRLPDDEKANWLRRLNRAQGPGRTDVVQEWRSRER